MPKSSPTEGPDLADVHTLHRAATGRNFHLLWFGEGVSVLGNATTAVLIPLLAVVHLHAGAAWMGTLTAAAWLPWLVVGLPAGAWVDRMPPRMVMIMADLVSAVALLSVPVAWWVDVLTLVQLLVVALVGGIATVFFRTAYVKLIPLVVPDQQLESANARLFGTESAMQIAGPGLAGFIAQGLSAALGIVVDALSFLVSALCLWRIHPATPAGGNDHPVRRTGLVTQIREGVGFVAHDRNLRAITIIGGLSNLGLTGYAALLVLFFVRDLGLSSAAVGMVMMIGSSGGLLGALIATRLARRIGTGRASTILLLISGPSALLIGLPTDDHHVYLSVLGLLLVGAVVVAGNVIRAAWRMRYVPAQLMGRVVTASQVINFGTMPVAGLMAGWMGSHLGVRTTIFAMAGIHLLACWSILLTAFGKHKVLPVRDTN